MSLRVASLAVTAVLAMPAAVFAQPAPQGWAVTVGAAPVVSPVFQGSKDYGASIFPDLRVNYGDVFFASVPDGIGYNWYNKDGWKLGPLAKVRFGREEQTGGSPFLIAGDSNALRGLGNVETAAELGGFMQYANSYVRTRLELRQGFGGHQGVVADAGISYLGRSGPVGFSFGPRLSYASADYMNTYFGINGGQSARSGLAAYHAQGGLSSYGVGGSATMPFTGGTALTLFAGYDRLGQEPSDSPLVRQRGSANQFSIGLAVGYRFNLGQ